MCVGRSVHGFWRAGVRYPPGKYGLARMDYWKAVTQQVKRAKLRFVWRVKNVLRKPTAFPDRGRSPPTYFKPQRTQRTQSNGRRNACGGSFPKSTNAKSHSDPLVRGRLVCRRKHALLNNYDEVENLTGSRTQVRRRILTTLTNVVTIIDGLNYVTGYKSHLPETSASSNNVTYIENVSTIKNVIIFFFP